MTTTKLMRYGWLACLVVALGCNRGSGPKLSPVSGTVTVAGGEPFSGGSIRFIPPATSKLNSREATTDSQGRFKIEFYPGQPGLEPGDYKVLFSLYQMPDGSPVADPVDEEDPHPTQLGAVQWVPAAFEFGTAEACAVTITKDGGQFDFELPELKPQPANAGMPQAPRR